MWNSLAGPSQKNSLNESFPAPVLGKTMAMAMAMAMAKMGRSS
jgi:hypothetical protein